MNERSEDRDDRDRSDDVRLSSLIDGELDAAEVEALETRLEHEPALAARLAAMRRADRKLRESYGPVADVPLPARLETLLQDRSATSAEVVPLGHRGARRQFWLPASIAASIALAVGVGLGLSLALRDGVPAATTLLAANELVEPERELFGVLERVASGETADLPGGAAATPLLSFRTAAGAYCRELEIVNGARQAALVGCREAGGWRLAAVVEVARRGFAQPDDSYVPAAGPATGLDAIVEAMIAGPPLGAEAERTAMAQGWR